MDNQRPERHHPYRSVSHLCTICHKSFRKKKGLRSHQTTVHPSHRPERQRIPLVFSPTRLTARTDGIPTSHNTFSGGSNDPNEGQIDHEIHEPNLEPLCDQQGWLPNGSLNQNSPTTPMRDPSPSTPPHPQREGWNTCGNHQQARAQATFRTEVHPAVSGTPCSSAGDCIPPGTPPPSVALPDTDDWYPWASRGEYLCADFLFRDAKMSGRCIDTLMQIWSIYASQHGVEDIHPPFINHKDVYSTIDAVELGEVPWQSFTVSYSGDLPPVEHCPPWMAAEYEVWYRDPEAMLSQQLSDKLIDGLIDYAPKRLYDVNGVRQYIDFMSGDWAWKQADKLYYRDPELYGDTVLCPVILGSDKTTVSVATGQHDYYPLYLSNGLVHNNVRRAHGDAMNVIAFLAIPKTTKEYTNSAGFRTFRRQLIHSTLHHILRSLLKGMTEPQVKLCADGHYRRVVYRLGPYIADYPEQALFTCVVQGWCPKCTANSKHLDDDPAALPRTQQYREALLGVFTPAEVWRSHGFISDVIPYTVAFPDANIHELIAPDILHQIVKGIFKDHLVDWTVEYVEKHYKADAKGVLADIDRRIATVPSFRGLRRFPQGRDFKQWTGDDSKALMKVILPALIGYVPDQMVKTFSALLEFCYIVRRNTIDEMSLSLLQTIIQTFHQCREVFVETGVRSGLSLPRQHSIMHWPHMIRLFGAPNGLCTSITENLHCRKVKQAWRRSNRNEPLEQMLLINQRTDKLSLAFADFTTRGMLSSDTFGLLPHQNPYPSPPSPAHQDPTEEVEPTDAPKSLVGEVHLAKTYARRYHKTLEGVTEDIGHPDFPFRVRQFLYQSLHPGEDASNIAPEHLPLVTSRDRVRVFHSATATFYAPSDICGVQGMLKERIYSSCRPWRGGPPRRDCIIAEVDPDIPGMGGLYVAQVLCFFSIQYLGKTYPCAFVRWFTTLGDAPCDLTGMWKVAPEVDADEHPLTGVIHIDSILRSVHLIPQFGMESLKEEIHPNHVLDAFSSYYVNKYADNHSHETVF